MSIHAYLAVYIRQCGKLIESANPAGQTVTRSEDLANRHAEVTMPSAAWPVTPSIG